MSTYHTHRQLTLSSLNILFQKYDYKKKISGEKLIFFVREESRSVPY